MDHLHFIKNLKQSKQGSNEWLEDRKDRLTSSDAATALGINPYKKSSQLLFEKCGLGNKFDNEFTKHGQTYEGEAINQYEKLMGKIRHDFGMIKYESLNELRDRHLNKEEYHFLGGSPDGIIVDEEEMEPLIMLEVKCPLKRKIKHGQVPDYYYPQIQLNMFILDLKIADFVEYIPNITGKNMEMNIVRIYRSEEWFHSNINRLINFWNEVKYWRTNDITKHPDYFKLYRQVAPTYMFILEPDLRL